MKQNTEKQKVGYRSALSRENKLRSELDFIQGTSKSSKLNAFRDPVNPSGQMLRLPK